MSDPVAVVGEFVSAMNADTNGMIEACRRYFTPSTIWNNVGFARTVGADEAIGLINQLGANMGMAAMKFDLLAIAAVGNKVLTERIDYMLDASGNTLATIPLMGIFELDADGKISRWSDYFDTAGFQAGSAGNGE
ncbi:limonene-1,2-epoxide hydrolase family protein [Sphingomonas sp. Leaf62]|uniref:limonene-1,2-epoxide hydrolase family protein n=1 Tax=Sphingomonas sp. Leaf62 TaxID=1736228 RepID=UPI0007023691|nr:limonene-1,2-epoxide hydrolase family protein [Sphingomonas sp. Leaf62]KQN69653.1 limonene-1,2-epoxide hydrolase [Sphingomonas sp. Leaf62]